MYIIIIKTKGSIYNYCHKSITVLHARSGPYIYDLVPESVHENRTKGVENKIDDTLKLVVFLEYAQS